MKSGEIRTPRTMPESLILSPIQSLPANWLPERHGNDARHVHRRAAFAADAARGAAGRLGERLQRRRDHSPPPSARADSRGRTLAKAIGCLRTMRYRPCSPGRNAGREQARTAGLERDAARLAVQAGDDDRGRVVAQSVWRSTSTMLPRAWRAAPPLRARAPSSASGSGAAAGRDSGPPSRKPRAQSQAWSERKSATRPFCSRASIRQRPFAGTGHHRASRCERCAPTMRSHSPQLRRLKPRSRAGRG